MKAIEIHSLVFLTAFSSLVPHIPPEGVGLWRVRGDQASRPTPSLPPRRGPVRALNPDYDGVVLLAGAALADVDRQAVIEATRREAERVSMMMAITVRQALRYRFGVGVEGSYGSVADLKDHADRSQPRTAQMVAWGRVAASG